MAPQPPANRVTPLAFGQPYTGPNGEQLIAKHDGVLTEFLIDGQPAASLFQTVESAMAFASTIATAAGRASAFQITDDGRPASALERILRLNGSTK